MDTRLTELVGRLLPSLDAAFPTELVDVLAGFLTECTGAEGVELMLADYDLEVLVQVRHDEPAASAQSVPVSGSDAGRAFTTQATVAVPDGDTTVVYLPVSLRAERLGVLQARLPYSVPADTLEGLQQAATVVAYVVFAASRFTDMYEQARRRKRVALDAEMQWNLLPIRAFTAPQFEVAGQLMPAYDVGGDSFDYSVETDALNLTVTDAMGHGVGASLLDALAVAALRNGRRAALDLAEQVQQAHRALHSQFAGAQFVVALVARVELETGRAAVVNAGHPAGYRLRHGRLSRIDLRPQLPLGLFAQTTYYKQRFTLRPGDRLFFASDGVTEAGPRGAEPFGEKRLQGVLLATARQPPHEAVRQVLRTVSAYQQGAFRDDATALCLDWRSRADHGP